MARRRGSLVSQPQERAARCGATGSPARNSPFPSSSIQTEGDFEKGCRGSRHNDTNEITLTYSFDYQYDAFPQEMIVVLRRQNTTAKQPFVTDLPGWRRMGGRSGSIISVWVHSNRPSVFRRIKNCSTMMGGQNPVEGLFTYTDPTKPVKGVYQVVITGMTFEQGADINAEFVFQGKVFGRRRHRPPASRPDGSPVVGHPDCPDLRSGGCLWARPS